MSGDSQSIQPYTPLSTSPSTGSQLISTSTPSTSPGRVLVEGPGRDAPSQTLPRLSIADPGVFGYPVDRRAAVPGRRVEQEALGAADRRDAGLPVRIEHGEVRPQAPVEPVRLESELVGLGVLRIDRDDLRGLERTRVVAARPITSRPARVGEDVRRELVVDARTCSRCCRPRPPRAGPGPGCCRRRPPSRRSNNGRPRSPPACP